jgi:putative transferase (TIGR04331 family)
MRFNFQCENSKTGEPHRFFLSNEDFKSHVNLDSETRFCYLTLGDKLSDWVVMSQGTTEGIYEKLLTDDPGRLRHLHSEIGSTIKQKEVLFGNLAWRVALRFARTTAQLSQINPEDFHIDSLQSLNMRIEVPFSTKDSYSQLQSVEMEFLIDHLAVASYFNSPISVEIKLESPKEAYKNSPKVPNLTRKFYIGLQKLLAPISRKNQYSISSSYLGRLEEALLNLSLYQIPHFNELRPNLDGPIREFNETLYLQGSNSLYECARFVYQILLPYSLAEGFNQTLARAHSIGFPVEPKLIFTANSYDSDDEFKVHLASALPGARYVVAQHGVGFGVSKNRSLCPEMRASDYFLSWGWASDDRKVVPFGLVKPISDLQKKFRNSDPKKRGVTILLRPETFSFYLGIDMDYLNDVYLNKIIDLCKRLDELGVHTFIRPHHTISPKTRMKLKQELCGLINISLPEKSPSLKKVLSANQGLVFTYDSTGMLEMSALRQTFFAFLPEDLGLINENFKRNYESLRDAGLLSDSPIQAASWIADWVKSDSAKQIKYLHGIEEFSRGIVRTERHRVSRLRKLLVSSLNSPARKS